MNISGLPELFEFIDRRNDMPENADFCLTLPDDSMAPFFPAGSDVYVSTSCAPAEFDAAVFFYEGKVLCRQWCEDFSGAIHLLPANPGFRNSCIIVPKRLRGKCLCLGRIIYDRKLPHPAY